MNDEEYEQMSIIYVRNYLNKDFTDEEIKNNYSLALKKIVSNIKDLEDVPIGISETKSGEDSITYSARNIMTNDIKSLLPKPFIKLF